MVRVWISPEGDYVSTTSQAAHEEQADIILAGLEKKGAVVDPGERELGWPSNRIIAMGWVRYSEGNVEGRPDFIEKNWRVVRDFAESDVTRYGMNATVWFDIWSEDGVRVRSFSVPLGTVAGPRPPAGVFREPSVVQQYRAFDDPNLPRYRRPVRVRSHRRKA